MEFKLYKCEHCGNIAWKLIDSGVPMVCCGEKMGELKAGVTDAAVEKHVPAIGRNADVVKVEVGSVIHPMVPEHYIQIIAAVGEDTAVIKLPKPGDAPVLEAGLKEKISAYEYCNLHGFWKAEE